MIKFLDYLWNACRSLIGIFRLVFVLGVIVWLWIKARIYNTTQDVNTCPACKNFFIQKSDHYQKICPYCGWKEEVFDLGADDYEIESIK